MCSMYAAEQSGSSVFASMPIIPLLLGADKDRRALLLRQRPRRESSSLLKQEAHHDFG